MYITYSPFIYLAFSERLHISGTKNINRVPTPYITSSSGSHPTISTIQPIQQAHQPHNPLPRSRSHPLNPSIISLSNRHPYAKCEARARSALAAISAPLGRAPTYTYLWPAHSVNITTPALLRLFKRRRYRGANRLFGIDDGC